MWRGDGGGSGLMHPPGTVANPLGAMHPPGTMARPSGPGMHLAWLLAHWANARTRHGGPAHRAPGFAPLGTGQGGSMHAPGTSVGSIQRAGHDDPAPRAGPGGKRLPARRPEIVVPRFGVGACVRVGA